MDRNDPPLSPAASPASTPVSVASKPRPGRRRYVLGASALLCVATWLLFVTQPDALAWLMVFPRWTWSIGGLVLWGIGLSPDRRRLAAMVVLLWVAHTLCNIEESRSLLRLVTAAWRTRPAGGAVLRIVTFNCGSGDEAAIEEAFSWNPDLILFQESSTRETIERIASHHWGTEASVAWGPDAVIAARGPFTLRKLSPDGVWIWGTWHRNEGDIEVVSLRRHPVPLRFDFWSGDCWRELSSLRRTHRDELRDLFEAVTPLTAGRRCIVGGDFNSPAQDPTQDLLRRQLRDPFDTVGTGWGNTIVNGFAVHRIDQIWATVDFAPLAAKAFPSRYSDHKGVAVELIDSSPR